MTKIKLATHGTVSSLSIGFLLSLLLTLSSYFIATSHLVAAPLIVGVILCLAFMQFTVQMIYFLHLDKEAKPRWKLAFFLSMASIILLVVIGSIWIMNTLNYRMMPRNIDRYIMKDEAIHKQF